jgi:CRP-like cAMP-binding protein
MATAEELRRYTVFEALSDEQREKVAALSHHVVFEAGERIFDEGQEAGKLWLIRAGRVTLDVELPGARPIVIQTIGRGDVLGWSWLMPPYRWHFGATASERVEADEIDAARLRDMADADPAFGYPLMRVLFSSVLSRLNGTRARLLDLYGSPRER